MFHDGIWVHSRKNNSIITSFKNKNDILSSRLKKEKCALKYVASCGPRNYTILSGAWYRWSEQSWQELKVEEISLAIIESWLLC